LTLKAYLTEVRTYWKIFAAVAVTVFALCLLGLLFAPTKYVSTTQLMVSIDGSTTATAYQNDDLVAGRINSYIALLTTDVVSQRVIDKLGLPLTAPEMAAKISATNVPPKTSIIDVSVTDRSPSAARRLASTVASEFVSYTDALESPTGEDGQKVHTTVVTPASEPSSRVAKRVILGVLAALSATLLGAIAVWIASRIDPVVRTPDRAAAVAGVPVLGTVTSCAVASVAELEGYRRLRAQLRLRAETGAGSVWMLTSAAGEVDATVIAANLARAMELAGSRSILLDAGVQAGSAPNDGDSDESDDAENDRTDWPEPEIGQPGFPDKVSLSASTADPDLLALNVATNLVDALRTDYDHVIIAAPPIISTVAISVLSESADAVLLVISLGATRRRNASRAAEALNATGAPLIGAVLVDPSQRPCRCPRTTDG
jgi:capsular polysaccharide biosynthesis protein